MDRYTQGRLSSQVSRVQKCRQQIVEDQDLCFTRLLPKEQVKAVTPENQKAYPQQSAQKKGLGFPIMRLVGLISLSSGTVLDVAMARYSAAVSVRAKRHSFDSYSTNCKPGISC